MLGECCLSGSNSSLNLLVLVFVSGAVSLYHVVVAFNVMDLSVVDICDPPRQNETLLENNGRAFYWIFG